MEPQIIDYYNESPHGINVIDKLNEEYDELQSKCEYIRSITDRYIAPIHISKTLDEYKKYEKILKEEFPIKVREILKDVECGILSSYNLQPSQGILYHAVNNNTSFLRLDEEWFQDKLINELDNITKNKNRMWCKDRIDLSIQICLSKYDVINQENNEKIIDDLINHILDGNGYLPAFYTETVEYHTNEYIDNGLELDFDSLNCLNCYHCEKCGILEYYMEKDIPMRCQDCLYI